MTLVLTLYSRFGIVQVADRLVTAGGAVVNPAANKTVVYAARDGIISIGYTGLAHLHGVPTDKWLAGRLGGIEPDAHFVFRNSRLPQWLDVGQATIAMRDGVDDAYAHRPARTYRRWPQVFAVAGWQWDRSTGRARPVVRYVDKKAGEVTAGVVDTVPRQWDPYEFHVTAMPNPVPGIFSGTEMDELNDRLRPKLHDTSACSLELASMIREASRRVNPMTIGPHCMCVEIPAPYGAINVRVTFRPDIAAYAPDGVAAYMPWVILGDVLAVAPSSIQGSYGPMAFTGAGAEVTLNGEPPT